MTDMMRINKATDATSDCLPRQEPIKLQDLYKAVTASLGDIRLGDFRAAVLRLVDSGEAQYQGTETIIRLRPAKVSSAL
ncbi:hypothetical protein [Bythopirellula polymerisocia]|uniref:Uncharacterized protein n=1 Tax=Bythopirellula polymerisocia TaxID=2528003 RepID=A0A5C6CV74_9BACT|nr:hypothetical protein [Bythopirellula polymerisocia]TWU27564.1 hypothetical protein Pla144_23410 [Bythopirellula polymerisocia]